MTWPAARIGMDELIRTRDWARTPLGPRAAWPQALRTLVDVMLDARPPLAVAWGPDLAFLCNDSWLASIVEIRPDAVGLPARSALAGVWTALEPAAASVLSGQGATALDRVALPARDGARGERSVDLTLNPVDDGGRVGGIFIVPASSRPGESPDVERSLRDSEERFRSFAENSADVLWIVDAERGELEYLSPAFDRIWGERRGRVMGHLSRWRDLVHEEDRARVDGGLPRLRTGETLTLQYRIVHPTDGTVRWIRDTGFPIRDEAGRVRRFAGIAQDVTDQRQSADRLAKNERRLRSLMEGIPQLIWRSLDEGRWTWASPQWCAYTGQSEEDSRGYGWLDALHPDDRAKSLTAWAQARNAKPFAVEHRIHNAREGRYRWFQSRATPVLDERGAVVEWLGTSTDIDDLRQMQERQRTLLAELQHRVRNTLAVIRSIARRTAETSESVEAFVAHFDGRINAFARTQSLVARDPAAGIDLEFLVAEELLAYRARDGDQVRISGPPIRLQPKAAETLALALHELATNAVKHGALSHRQGRLTVTWAVRPEQPPELVLSWMERGLTLDPAAPRRRGFGMDLLEHTLTYDLGASAIVTFTPEGLRCVMAMPLTERLVTDA